MIHNCLEYVNEHPDHGLKGKFTEQIDKMFEKHGTVDRMWRYSREKRDFYSLQDLIDRREENKEYDQIVTKEDVDLEIEERAKAAAKTLKRMKMAKYS